LLEKKSLKKSNFANNFFYAHFVTKVCLVF
jgi:hypothetical protein